MKAVPALLDISATWQARLRPAQRRALFGTFLCLAVTAFLVARQGTPATRLVALTLLGGSAALGIARSGWQRRQSRNVKVGVKAIVETLDRPLASQLVRAIELVEVAEAQAPRVSEELAALHLQRIVSRVPMAAVEELAMARAARLGLFSTLAILASLGLVLLVPLRVFEGFDVLLARGNVAPMPMHLVELAPVTVQPPAYLHGSPDSIEFDSTSAQPQGSLVIVRGMPSRDGLELVVTDGTRDVPFVSDGQGGITARYQLESTVRLRVAARFGRVLVLQSEVLLLDAIADRVPLVELEGAPKRVSIGDNPVVDLHYGVADDHGIREIDLVLRAGAREERRLLVRLDGEAQKYTGAYVLDAADAFLTSSYGSVEVLVAARDDNNQNGASWGQSQTVIIDKPSLGQVQVRRRDAYLEVRNQLVDWLALAQVKPKSTDELAQHRSRAISLFAGLESGAINDPAMRKILRAFLRAQRDKLSRVPKASGRLAPLIEEVTLSVDSAFEAIAYRDAEHVSRLLADVAVEIESGARAISLGEQREHGAARVQAAEATLGTGAAELKRLGRLGGDLGEIALAGWLRIGHAIEANDYTNVERAASFLAERLRRPMPSFMGAGRAGVESGRRGFGRSNGAKASDADAHLERVAAELQQLAREHASGIEAVERLANDSERGLGTDDMKAAAKQHADEVRTIIEVLPPLGAEPGSARAALALSKELARGAAESLERLQLAGAYEGLSKADAALAEASLLRAALVLGNATLEPKTINELRKRLTEHRDWVKSMLDEVRESSVTKAMDLLRHASGREREMAERANRLAQREAQNDAVVPEDVRSDLEQSSRLMLKAVESLDAGRGRAALERQRAAQELLERNALQPDKEEAQSGEKLAQHERNSTGPANPAGGRIVSTSDAESRDGFRRRVQKGLSREVTPELSPAVRRYAEGLLK